MQKIPIDDTRFILFDDATNTSRVVIIDEEIAVCENNIQAIEQNLSNLPDLISVEGLTPEQKEAIDEKNAQLEQQRLAWQQELESFQAQLAILENLK